MHIKYLFSYLLTLLILCSSYANAAQPTILILGDSLSAAFGIKEEEGWGALLQTKLRADGYPHKVVNASVSGETTAGGASRAGKLINRYRPQVLILELGANDGLRGLTLKAMKANLSKIVEVAQHADTKVVLVGMHLPPNYGKAYTRIFHKTYQDIADQGGLAFVPFLFAGLEDGPNYFQADNLHPTALAQPFLLRNIWPAVNDLISPQKHNSP
ncbi:arylesterase [Pseudomonadota bacterium]